ncbi:MAG: DUF4190 domain-containing protein [Clostridia bacterium]|nr:DUF4190 domain-containing protein [Clostridia bacterium]
MSEDWNNAFSGGDTIADVVKDVVTPESSSDDSSSTQMASEPSAPQGYQPQQNPYAQSEPQQNTYEQSYQPTQSPYAQSTQGQSQSNPYAQPAYQPQPNPYAQQPQSYQPQPTSYTQQQSYQAQSNPYVQQPQGQPNYAAGYYQYAPTGVSASAGNDGFAVASLILGIAGILTCCTFVPSLLGLIFGIISKTKNDGTRPTGLSTAGIILGVIGMLLSVFWMFVFLGSGSYN